MLNFFTWLEIYVGSYKALVMLRAWLEIVISVSIYLHVGRNNYRINEGYCIHKLPFMLIDDHPFLRC